MNEEARRWAGRIGNPPDNVVALDSRSRVG
jgi:hypothetical protein